MKSVLIIKAKKLREKGYSIKEIESTLAIPRGTVSRWVKDVELSVSAKKRIENNLTKGQRASLITIKNKIRNKELESDKIANNTLRKLDINENHFLLLCSMIYQCEGSKSIKDSVTFTNSDPELIKNFLFLFRKSFKLKEDKFRVLMHLHNYHNEDTQKHFWSNLTGVPTCQFLKTFQKNNTGIYKKENYQGCIQVRYRDVQIGRIIKAVAKKFMERYK